jgi:hypothetical protein
VRYKLWSKAPRALCAVYNNAIDIEKVLGGTLVNSGFLIGVVRTRTHCSSSMDWLFVASPGRSADSATPP